jgi:hypothetical protein
MRPTLIADERECAGYLAYPLGVHAKSHVLERITQVASTGMRGGKRFEQEELGGFGVSGRTEPEIERIAEVESTARYR